MPPKTDVQICLGSSCFSRGNKESLEAIKSYIEANGLTDKISFRGNLCKNICSKGPTITINGTAYRAATPAEAIRLIEQSLKAGE